jgi:predicted Zn finger-like uncharacterized protein
MPIMTSCPYCGEPYNVHDRQLGKKVRCKQCNDVFTVAEEGISQSPAQARIRSGRSERLSAPAPRDRRDRDDRDGGGPDGRPAPRSSEPDEGEDSSGHGLLIAAVGLLLLCAVGGVVVWLLLRDGDDKKGSSETTVASAVQRLKSSDKSERLAAAQWLAKANIDTERQQEVLLALTPLLTDTDLEVQQAARDAHTAWMTVAPGPDGDVKPPPPGAADVETLVAWVNNNIGGQRSAAIAELGKRKEARGASAIAAYLSDFGERDVAVKALREIGQPAESAVVAYMHHPDMSVRDMARSLLQGYGSKEDLLLTQSMRDLGSSERGRQQHAAVWLAQAPRVQTRAADVASALERALETQDRDVRGVALKALLAWGSKENVPAIATALMSPAGPFFDPWHKEAMQALAKFKDPRGAAALCAWLAVPSGQDEAANALKAIGSKAEKEVAKFFNHPEVGARDHARELLKEYGTGDDVLLQQSVQDLRGREVGRRKLAAEWLGKAKVNEARRTEAADALGDLLKEKDEGAQEAAVRALVRWGNKGNVAALAALVDAEGFGHARTLRSAAMEALGAIKDEGGVIPVAKRLLDHHAPTAREASKSLKAMGSVAEPVVLTFLGNVNPNIRIEACQILEVIGTKESVKPLTAASRSRDRNVAAAATQALQAVNLRNK